VNWPVRENEVASVGIGIIGCGKATQALHLPSLKQLPGEFRIAAVCDASAHVARGVAERWAVAHWATEVTQLLSRPDVDAVLVSNPNRFHVPTAIAALKSGKHVLIEKPAAMSIVELDELIAAQRASGCIVQVGYMRRFAPGYRAALGKMDAIGDIRVVRVHDLIDAGLQLLSATTDIIRDPIADAGSLNLNQDESAIIDRAIGQTSVPVANAYQLLLRLGCHDLSAMRGLIGRPRGVLHAAERWNGAYVNATFDYGDFLCQFDVGLNIVSSTNAWIEVVGSRGTLTLEYQLPYVRHLPARLTTAILADQGDVVTEVHDSHGKDQFVLEWLDFHSNIRLARCPENSLLDAREDLEIAMDVIDALRDDKPAHQRSRTSVSSALP
jgi:predicted dehydrogenase